MFTHKPMWVVWLMKMGDCEPSYGYGKAHVVSGHWFSPWHTGREPNLSNPFQGLFFWPGFLRGFLCGFWLFLPPPWTVQNGSERRMNGSGVFPLKKSRKTYVRTHVRTYVTTHVKVSEWFRTVQNGEWTVQGYSPLKKAWKTYVRTHVRTHVTTHVKVSERFRTVQNGEWTVQGYSPLKRHDGLQLWVYFGLLWAMSFTWSLTWTATWTATWTLTCLEVGVCWPQT